MISFVATRCRVSEEVSSLAEQHQPALKLTPQENTTNKKCYQAKNTCQWPNSVCNSKYNWRTPRAFRCFQNILFDSLINGYFRLHLSPSWLTCVLAAELGECHCPFLRVLVLLKWCDFTHSAALKFNDWFRRSIKNQGLTSFYAQKRSPCPRSHPIPLK